MYFGELWSKRENCVECERKSRKKRNKIKSELVSFVRGKQREREMNARRMKNNDDKRADWEKGI